MLEEGAAIFKQIRERGRTVIINSTCQREVMSAFNRINRIDLHEPHALDQIAHTAGSAASGWIIEQPLRAQQEASALKSADERHLRRYCRRWLLHRLD